MSGPHHDGMIVRTIRSLRPRLLLAVLLLGAGCTGVGEREAQSEFERLRRGPTVPRGERVLPSFGTDPVAEDSRPFTWRPADHPRQP